MRLHRSARVLLLHAAWLLAGSAGMHADAAFAQATRSAPASKPQAQATETLAGCVPADAALYLEIRGMQRLLGTSAGAGVASTVFQVIQSAASSAPATSSSSAPAQPVDQGPRQLFASAVGLKDGSNAIQMLFSGPVALAADGWSGLSDAILLAWPADPAALEKELAARPAGQAASSKVRRYALGNGHELACDGRTAVVGRWKRTSLYSRTLDLLNGNGSPLADLPEFRERIAGLGADAQLIAYMGKAGPAGENRNPLEAWWPEDWPRINTLGLGVAWGLGGANLTLSARLDADGPQLKRSEPPIQVLRRLPGSVVAAWTQAVDYVADYRRLRSRQSLTPDGFRFDALEAGLDPGTVENRILAHLVGDTVLVIDQVTVQPKEAGAANEPLQLPIGAILVETDDPDAVAGALPLVANNLVQLLNSQLPAGQTIAIRQEPSIPGGPVIYSIPIGAPQTDKTQCDLLQALELSWTVSDRWLVVATHSQTVRRLVEARRGVNPALGVADLDKVVEQVVERGGQPRRVLFAQPRSGTAMIETWIRHVSKHHPEMLQAQWWERLLRRQRAMGKQVGILARADHGMVEVVDALPGGPARGRLVPGDRILAVDGIKVDPAKPLQSLRDAVSERGRPEKVILLVRRADKEQEIELPMPTEEIEGGLRSPVELLRRLSDMCRIFGSASYVLWQPKPDVVDARVDLRYFASPSPRVPASSPARASGSPRAEAARPATNPSPATQPSPATKPSSITQPEPLVGPSSGRGTPGGGPPGSPSLSPASQPSPGTQPALKPAPAPQPALASQPATVTKPAPAVQQVPAATQPATPATQASKPGA